MPRQRFLDFGYRIEPVLGGVARRGGPGTQVAGELRQRPPHLHLDGGERYLVERKWNCPVPIQQQLPLRKPVWLQRPPVELVNCSVEWLGVEDRITVAPHCYRAAGGEHPPRFSEERGRIEPMKRLRRGDEIDRPGGKAGGFRARNPVLDPLMSGGAADLLFAGIGADDAVEMIRQAQCSLTVAGAAIKRDAMLSRQSGQTREEGIRIPRAVGGVEGRAIGEVILELQKRLRRRRAGASTPDSGCDSAQ